MGNGSGAGSGTGSGRGAPPPPPPRSRVPHPALRSPRGAPPEPGPHSWHNSTRPQPPSSSPSPRSNGEDEAAASHRSPRASSGSEGEGQTGAHRHRAARKKKKESGGWESPADGGDGEAEGCGRVVPRHPLPVVARVSKVNILPFGSPGGSRSSSRYSSTETLKEEEQFGICWPNQGRTLQAGYGVYRSPSFGTSDGLAWGQPVVRVRPKLPQGTAKAKPDFGSESLHQPGLEGERAKHRKSLSNPDIATETLTLLSFLKSDLSELKVKKKGVRIGLDMGSDGCSGISNSSPGSRGPAQPPNRWAPGERPTLKDLTATLRRAKSFTCSEKPGTRRLFLQSTMKQSSSELLLATADSQDQVASDGGQRRDEDALPVVIQDQYIQEARQVFEKISRMGSQQDYGFTAKQKDSGGVEGAEVVAPTGTTDATLRGQVESTRCLKEAESEENLARRKSVEELSGHESSVTDEGIVTEPEPAGMPFQDLREAVDAWTLPNAGPAAGDTETPLPAHPAAALPTGGPPRKTHPPPAPAILAKSCPATKHVRHTSEPTTFVPITVPEPLVSSGHHNHLPVPAASRSPGKSFPTLQPPSLQDVTKRYMLALNSGDASSSPGDGPRSPPAAPPPRLPRCPRPPNEHGPRTKPQVDMRKHVIMTLLDTEQSYVESLRTLMQGYMKPLKQPENSLLCDPSLVDEIFDQIPELLEHHEQFLEQIHDCVQNWHEKQKVGDLLVQSFSKDVLVNIYSAYIDNFLNAKDAVRIAKEARPAFMKFLEQSMRENKEKQALSDLMIKPVQRIPRYELLVKDLLKHTPEDHPDHPFLIDAQRNIKQVAERINKGMKSAEEVERNARIVQEIESHIEGMEDLQAPLRRFLRQEMVVEVKAVGGKKDRSFFLFTDLLVCTTLKRKSGSLRRSSMSLYTAASVIDTASKYKLLWKLPLEDVDIVKGASQATNRESIQKSICRLDEDLSTLGQVSKLSETLSFPHQSLDDVIKDLMAAIHRELAEKQSLSFSMAFPPNKVELSTTKADGTESFIFEFPNPDARLGFEQAFEDAKKKLASSKNCLDPEFLKAIPIMKTRSGMQFSCASPSHGSPESSHEVWVCNSDGYVGQVCLLSIRKEPTVEACIAVCSARILCIASLSEPVDGGNRELVPFDSDDTDDESSPSPSGTLQSQASHSTISSSFGNEEIPSCKEATAETTSSEEEQEPGFMPITSTYGQNRHGESPTDGRALRRSSRGSFTRGSLEDLLSLDPEAHQSSMWLGTEDGCIHVYQSSDNIRNRKNSMKMQHAAAVMCILYLDNQVFVSLANGELVAYQREAGRFWDPQNSKSLSLGSPGSPITKMVAVAGKLWCGCQNRVIVLNTATLAQEHTLQVGQDGGRSVTCMVSAGTGVWVALQSSAQVRLYHATSYEQLAEADITPPVHKMLAGSDAIIRQHKAACLRITALLVCKDLLWIGTSAGVVLTLAVSAKAAPALVGLSQGHTGHVRFLTAIELPDGFDVLFPLSPPAMKRSGMRWWLFTVLG
ncbi:PREDICTED: rho guanine nucleotide exchange factor 17, partial [Pygoscelis adeliae]|uniref:rho guanine nucleotide exchange factor 17 n=1 Tax=Pygoscelis adeliae TaxID=9238 RepID=UPI0004F4E3A0